MCCFSGRIPRLSLIQHSLVITSKRNPCVCVCVCVYIYIYRCGWRNWYWYICDALVDTMSLKQKRNLYDAQLKLKVIKSAKENNSAADRPFVISEQLVRLEKAEEIFIWNPRTKRAKCYGVSPYIKLETALNDWVLEYRHNGYITRMIKPIP